MSRIFISHASFDNNAVDILSQWMSEQGYDHFVDHHHIEVGVSWDEALRREASRADILILYITGAWLASEECFAEYRSSFYGDRTVLPLLVQPLREHELKNVQRKRLATLCNSVQGVPIKKLPPVEFEAEQIKSAIVRVEREADVARRKRFLIQFGFAAAVLLTTLLVLAVIFADQVQGTYKAWNIDRKIQLESDTNKPFFDCLEDGEKSICPEMVPLAGSNYTIGFEDGDEQKASDLGIRGVTIRPFAISRNEITKEQWHACVLSTRFKRQNNEGCRELPFSEEEARKPVDSISWEDAQGYVRWLNQQLGQEVGPYRLPSEAEWEYAARGGQNPRTAYFWGNGLGISGRNPTWIVCRYANALNTDLPDELIANRKGIDCSRSRAIKKDRFLLTSPVGELEANQFGLFDMAGNVSEWVEDCWHKSHTEAPNELKNGGPWASNPYEKCDRILKGGSWFGDIDRLRPAARGSLRPDGYGFNIGMRIARDLKR